MHKKTSPKTLRYAALILTGLATTGCEKLGATHTPKQLTIPVALGDLVAVTPGAGPMQSVLWLKQPDQSIVAVRVSVQRGTIEAEITKFPRH
jgi:hypothetical protein